jgi:hypothetical protein
VTGARQHNIEQKAVDLFSSVPRYASMSPAMLQTKGLLLVSLEQKSKHD